MKIIAQKIVLSLRLECKQPLPEGVQRLARTLQGLSKDIFFLDTTQSEFGNEVWNYVSEISFNIYVCVYVCMVVWL